MSSTRWVVNGDGVPWLVRLVRRGDRYGLRDCLTHDDYRPLVEFYDGRWLSDGRSGRGQFVSRYYVETFLGVPVERGLCLDGGVPSWVLDSVAVSAARRWVVRELGGAA